MGRQRRRESSFNFDYTTLGYAYQEPAAIEFRINDELSGYISFKNEFWVGLEYKSQAEQKTWLSLKSTEKNSLNYLIVEARKFRKLLSFFIGQKVRIKRMIFYSEDHLVKVINPSKHHVPERQPVELLFDDNEIYRELPGRSVYYINFEDIEANIEAITQKWFSLVDSGLAPITDLMLQGITDHYFYDDADFLRAWQGVEAFHRIILQDTPALIQEFNSWFNKLDEFITDPKILENIKMRMGKAYETSARNRLKFVLKENADILSLNASKKQMDFWIREIIESRNYLTHLDPQSESKKAETQHLFNYTGLLKALLIVMIFKELQIHEELLKRVGSHSTFNLTGLLKIGHRS